MSRDGSSDVAGAKAERSAVALTGEVVFFPL